MEPPNIDLGAQVQRKNPKSQQMQLDLGGLEEELRFRVKLGPSPPLEFSSPACSDVVLD